MVWEFLKSREIVISLVISLLVGLFAGVAVYHVSVGDMSEGEASSLVSDAFEAQGQDVEVASVERESSSVYRVIVESGEGLDTVFVSSDGEFMLLNPVESGEYIEFASQRSEFVECLESEDVSIIGVSGQQATQLQLQALGGFGLENIYVEADEETVTELEAEGVEELPVTVYEGELFEGVQDLEFFEEVTGCSFEA